MYFKASLRKHSTEKPIREQRVKQSVINEMKIDSIDLFGMAKDRLQDLLKRKIIWSRDAVFTESMQGS